MIIAIFFGPRWQLEGSYGRVCPSGCLGVLLEFYRQFFLNFGMVLETHMKLGVTEPNFPEKKFIEFIKKFGDELLLNLFYNEDLYYLLCSCTNPIFGKIFVPEIWAKMFSVSQIAEFFDQQYLQNKFMKQPDFCLGDTNSHELNVDQKILAWA